MSAHALLAEAERMYGKLQEIGPRHENAKFLSEEILRDLVKAERFYAGMEANERADVEKRVRDCRNNTQAFMISR